jgi:hypothetical protein
MPSSADVHGNPVAGAGRPSSLSVVANQWQELSSLLSNTSKHAYTAIPLLYVH